MYISFYTVEDFENATLSMTSAIGALEHILQVP